MQGLQNGHEQPEASAQQEDARRIAGAAAADLAKAPREQWPEGEEDGASVETVHGSAEEVEGMDRSRDVLPGDSGAAVGPSHQEGDEEQRDYRWNDEVSHNMPANWLSNKAAPFTEGCSAHGA